MTASISKSLISLVLACGMLLMFFFVLPHQQAESGSSRFQHMERVIVEMDAGNFMQIGKGISINGHLYEDPGIGALAVVYIWTVKTLLHPGYVANWHIVFGIQFAIYAAVLALCCLVSDALIFIGFALVSIGASFLLGQATWSYNCYWAPSLAVIVAYMTVAAMLLEHRLRKGTLFFFASGCGLIVGVLGLLRQDATLIAQGSMMLFVLVHGLILLIRAAKKTPPPRQSKKIFLVSLIFILTTMLPAFAYREMLHVHQVLTGTRHDIGAGVHGVWHNLYIGLGYYPNKYGIKWDDSVGAAHAVREDPTATFGSKKYMPTLRRLYFRILVNDSVFFMATTAKKCLEMLQRLGGITCVAFLGTVTLLLFASSCRGRFFLYSTFILFPAWTIIVASVPPVLTIPVVPYAVGAQTAMLCGLAFVIAFLFMFIKQFEGRSVENLKYYSLKYLVIVFSGLLHVVVVKKMILDACSYIDRNWKRSLVVLACIVCISFAGYYYKDKKRQQLASKNIHFIGEIMQIAQIKTNAPLQEITKNSCSECPCRGIGNLQDLVEGDFCRVNWHNALARLWQAASGQSPFDAKGRFILEKRMQHDPWGAPYCLDENTQTIRSSGPDGRPYTDDDIVVSVRPQ
ncbi:hypothetical protein [Solidesulfovibrio sp. C21]|uniref:hypothetical protein n=1 Tax=Solidesulfovibrio sp. C21 TaxID=3398613 RepID=UPI0039FD7661